VETPRCLSLCAVWPSRSCGDKESQSQQAVAATTKGKASPWATTETTRINQKSTTTIYETQKWREATNNNKKSKSKLKWRRRRSGGTDFERQKGLSPQRGGDFQGEGAWKGQEWQWLRAHTG